MYGKGGRRARGAINITMVAHQSPSRIPPPPACRPPAVRIVVLAVNVLYLDCLWTMGEQTERLRPHALTCRPRRRFADLLQTATADHGECQLGGAHGGGGVS